MSYGNRAQVQVVIDSGMPQAKLHRRYRETTKLLAAQRRLMLARSMLSGVHSPLEPLPVDLLQSIADFVTADLTFCERMPELLNVGKIVRGCRPGEIISNFTSGSSERIQEVIDSGLITRLVELLSAGNPDRPERAQNAVRDQAAKAMSSVICGATAEQITHLVTQAGCMLPLCGVLTVRPRPVHGGGQEWSRTVVPPKTLLALLDVRRHS